jgi:diguanylate cyclase (GGDEF)-like protein/PAS domain S-box-containing protein
MSSHLPLGSDLDRHDPAGARGAAVGAGRFETTFDLAPVGICIVDLEGRTIWSNDVLRRSLGYSPEEFAAVQAPAFTHPDDIAANLDLFAQMIEANLGLFAQMVDGEIDHFVMEKSLIRKDGETLWVALTLSLVPDADGNPDYAIGLTQDITERKLFESDPHVLEERSLLQVERVPAIVYVAEPGPNGKWLYVSPQIEAILGFSAQEWMANPALWLQQLHPQDREIALAQEERFLASGEEEIVSSGTYRMRHRDGATVWLRDDAKMLCDHNGRVTWHGVLVDVTREKRLEERLEHQAFHDPLTGLPNRKLFHDRVSHALERRQIGQVAVLFIDLDNFKTVNDSFGHACGDEVIVAVARRLQACARAGDTPARFGGDEFALLVEDVTAGQAIALADRVLDILSETPVEFSGRTKTIRASVGIAVAGLRETTETLLRNADLAMYEAKLHGRSRCVLYEPSMHASVVSRFRIEAALQTALADGAITLAYQPIVDLRTGAVVGFEALARWSDDLLGDVTPEEFIPIAEETGLINDLGLWAIDQACRELKDWRSARGAKAYVSVNVSPLQLDNDRFASLVVRMLREHDLEPAALVIEVTEGVLLVERSRESLRQLRSYGIRVSIDDFGTGYSSLAYLRQLPADMVKIDQSFLRPLENNAAEPTFLRVIVRLAETLHLDTICEGVETRGQLSDLQAARCAHGQGYLLGRPGPLADFPAAIQVTARTHARQPMARGALSPTA